jgi:hypothetical protein
MDNRHARGMLSGINPVPLVKRVHPEDCRPPSNSGSTLSRRGFLGASVASLTGVMILPSRVLGRDGQRPPSEKLNIGVIGAGGRGADDLEDLQSENIVALCDVDQERAAETFKKFPSAKRYQDFRVMLEKETGLDAVLVATPDHTHAVATMAALHAGKHVYCEKPLTRTVKEARAVAQAAKAAKKATQMGNQGMAFEGNRLIKEWLAADVIGPVTRGPRMVRSPHPPRQDAVVVGPRH